MRFFTVPIFVLTFFLFAQPPCRAAGFLCVAGDYDAPQMGVGGIEGKLMGNMEAVGGAELVLMQKDKIIDKTTTDEEGHYFFKYVSPGHYDIKATKTGYRTSIIVQIPVAPDETTPNSFYLPKYNDRKMPSGPIVDDYQYNRRKYMRIRQ
jgi:Carboxypeptidase regulatory-like domain